MPPAEEAQVSMLDQVKDQSKLRDVRGPSRRGLERISMYFKGTGVCVWLARFLRVPWGGATQLLAVIESMQESFLTTNARIHVNLLVFSSRIHFCCYQESSEHRSVVDLIEGSRQDGADISTEDVTSRWPSRRFICHPTASTPLSAKILNSGHSGDVKALSPSKGFSFNCPLSPEGDVTASRGFHYLPS